MKRCKAMQSFGVQLASQMGVTPAIIIQVIAENMDDDGWTYLSYADIHEICPYWTRQYIGIVINRLVASGVLAKKQRNKYNPGAYRVGHPG